MSTGSKCMGRSDKAVNENGQKTWLWALEVTGIEAGDHFLVALYDLPTTLPMVRHRAGVTHEVTIFQVDRQTRVDFGHPLFDQKQLVLHQPQIAFQLTRETDEEAVASVTEVIQKIQDGKLDPSGEDIGPWADEFEDDVSLIAALPEPESEVSDAGINAAAE